jgi:hypothetical protein
LAGNTCRKFSGNVFWTGSSILPHLHQHSSNDRRRAHRDLAGPFFPDRLLALLCYGPSRSGGRVGGCELDMNFSKLDQNEKTAAMASAALVITGLIAAGAYTIYSTTWLAVIAALGLLFVVLQPQLAPDVGLPTSKGSLFLLLGGAAGLIMVVSLLIRRDFVFLRFGIPDLAFLIALAAGVAMAWAGWRTFQAEGGKLPLGASTVTPVEASTGAPSDEDRPPGA